MACALNSQGGHEQIVSRFCKQYQQRLDLGQLTWPSHAALQDVAMQERIWAAIEQMQNDRAHTAYDQRILKELMSRIEDAVKNLDDPEILDSFAELSATLFITPTHPTSASLAPAGHAPQDEYIWARYTIPWLSLSLPASITPRTSSQQPICIDILENPRVLAAAGCTGHRTWEAALYLASLLGYSPYLRTLLEGANVLELGAGTGLVSFAAAMLPTGPKSVRATDGDWGAVERLRRTEERRRAEDEYSANGCRVACDVLLWGADDEGGEAMGAKGTDVDVVLAADVTYDPVGIPDLVSTLGALLECKADVSVVIAATLRNADTLAVFEGECRRTGLEMEKVSDAKLGLVGQMEDLGIGGASRADVTKQIGFFHAPVAEIVVMSVKLALGTSTADRK